MKNYPALRQIQYFMALAETLSFSKAAEKCFITQSTLSAGVKELENILGKALFERSSRKVLLTPFGKIFWVEADKIIRQADAMLDRVQTVQDEPSGKFSIGFIPTIAPFYAPEYLNSLQQHYPKLELLLVENLTNNLLEQLRNGQIDAAVIALPYDLKGLEHHVLTEDNFFLVAPPTVNVKTPLTLENVNNMELLLLEDGHCLSDHAISACALDPKLKKQQHSIASIDTLLHMANIKEQATLMTEMMSQHNALQNKTLKRYDIGSTPPKRDIALIWRKTHNLRGYLPKIFA